MSSATNSETAMQVDQENHVVGGEDDENDDDDLVLCFSYRSNHKDELTIQLNNPNNSTEAKKPKRRRKGDKKIDSDGAIFKMWTMPDYLIQRGLYVECFSDYIVFYLDHIDSIDPGYSITQICDRGRILGTGYYTSNNIQIKNKFPHYLYNLRFNNNNQYLVYKAPNGNVIELNVDKLLLYLCFIFSYSEVNLFKRLNKFIQSFESYMRNRNDGLFPNENQVKRFVYYINFIYSVKNKIIEDTKLNENCLTRFICCSFGFLTINLYEYVKDYAFLKSEFIEKFIDSLSNVDADIANCDHVNRYFINGIGYVLYNCLKNINLFKHLMPLLDKLVDLNLINFSLTEIIEKFTNCGHFLIQKNFKSNDQVVKNYVKKLDEEKQDQKVPILISILLDLCPDVNCLLCLIDVFFDHPGLDAVFKEKHDMINKRLLKATTKTKISRDNFEQQYKNFVKHEKYLSSLKTEFYIYFINNCENFRQITDLIRNSKLTNEDRLVWVAFLEEISKRARELDILQLLDLINIVPKELNLDESIINTTKKNIKTVVYNKLQQIKPQFTGLEKEYIEKGLKNEIIFPLGSLRFMFENYIKNAKNPTTVDLNFLLLKILPFQLNEKNEFDLWIEAARALIKLVISKSYTDSLIQTVCEFQEILIIKLNAKEAVGCDIFRYFLQEYYEFSKESIDGLLNLLKYKRLFINEQLENIYVEFMNIKVFYSLKNKTAEDTVNMMQSILRRIDMNDKTRLQSKLMESLFSSAGNYEEDIRKIKEILFVNPSKEHYLLKILKLADFYTEIGSTKYLKDIRKNIRNAINDLCDHNIFVKDVESLKKLVSNDQIEVLQSYIDSSFDHAPNRPKAKQEVMNCIFIYDDNIQLLNCLKELLEFSKDYFEMFNELYAPLMECLRNKGSLMINQIRVPVNCEPLLKIIRLFDCDFGKIRQSNAFKNIFRKSFLENLKKSNIQEQANQEIASYIKDESDEETDENESEVHEDGKRMEFSNSLLVKPLRNTPNAFQAIKQNVNVEDELRLDYLFQDDNNNLIKKLATINDLFEIFEFTRHKFIDFKKQLDDSNTISNEFLNKYFNEINTEAKIEDELFVIKKLTGVGFEIIDFLKMSIGNIINIQQNRKLYENLLQCFKHFQVVNGNSSEFFNLYLNLTAKDKFNVADLNNLMALINGIIGNLYNKIEVVETIDELSKSDKLIEFLKDQNEEDIRSAIDGLDEHGDNHIRAQNFYELCKVSQFVKKLDDKKAKQSEDVFIATIANLIEGDEHNTFRNISALVSTSANLLESIKLILNTLQNREEADKIKIKEMGQNAEFKIEFLGNKEFNLKTVFRGKLTLHLADLYDLRDRALLMINNRKSAEEYYNLNQELNDENLKLIYDCFIVSIESLNSIVNSMNLIYDMGYPINETCNEKVLKILNKTNDEIMHFELEISNKLTEWKEFMSDLVQDYKILSYFWGRELFEIEKLLRNNAFKRVKEHLCFVNSNVMTINEKDFVKYPIINANQTPFERIKILADYLNVLFSQMAKEERVQMKNMKLKVEQLVLIDEQVILMKSDSNCYTNALLMCYRDYEKCYPLANQILFCSHETTWQELRSFLYRLMFNDDKLLYTLVGPERLNFEPQDSFLTNFIKLMASQKQHFIRLSVITCDFNTHITSFLSQLNQKSIKVVKTHYQNDHVKRDIIKTLIQEWHTNITYVTSAYSGLGKTIHIENDAKIKHLKLIKYPISECNSFIKMAERVEKLKNNNFLQIFNYAIHFDIYSSNNDEILNEFLFMILLLKIFKSNELVFFSSNVKHFYIEIANTYNENLRERISICTSFQNTHIDRFSIDNLIITDYEMQEPIRSDNDVFMQVVCNYLYLLANRQCAVLEFGKQEEWINQRPVYTYSDTQRLNEFTPMQHFDKNTCANLLKNFFIKHKNRIDSFIQLRNFINLAGYYLLKFSENGFLSVSMIKFIMEPLQDPNLRNIILELREKTVNMLLELALKGVTQSIDGAKYNATQTHAKLNINEVWDDHEIEMAAQKQIMDNLVNFENCNYLMVIFSEFDGQINLIYSDINVITNNIVTLFKSQDISKLQGFNEYHLVQYINDANDRSIFPDYRKEPHYALEARLLEIFKPREDVAYDFDVNLFNANLKPLVERLNRKLTQLNEKLDSYVLSADNFLKMILIYNKIKGNLPVVIMGETGCGKTSLISYLALKILKCRFIVYNIHAGITQKVFLNQINEYFLVADTLENNEIWIFFDEFNTSDCMYLISEMICKNTLLGTPIPKNLKLLAACNPFKLKSKKLEVGLVIERDVTRLLHIVYPLPGSLIDHVWDYGALSEQDEMNYVLSMIKSLKLSNHKMVRDLICYSQSLIRSIEEASSVSLRDVDRFRVFYVWFVENRKKRLEINNANNKFVVDNNNKFETECIILTFMICYYVRLSRKFDRERYLNGLTEIFNKHRIYINQKDLLNIYEIEQNEYLNRMNLSKGIAKNNALRENVFATFVCILNNVPIFICGKPGCSKTLCIQLLSSSLRGVHSTDAWFRQLPDIYSLTYQGSESSTSEGIIKVFDKAKQIAEQNANKVTPLIIFDEMGLAEISKNNPLKVLHSLLEGDFNKNISFVGISNWRLDASKMNRGVFLSRPDLNLDDLQNTAEVIFKSYLDQNDKDFYYARQISLVKDLAKAYYNYKESMSKDASLRDFHGTRDFYYLIKQVSEKLTNEKNLNEGELMNVINTGLKRNFEGIKNKPFDDINKEFMKLNLCYNLNNEVSTLELIEKNLNDTNSRYLMLITKSDSATFILDNFLDKHIENRITLVGSKFDADTNSEEYSFRTLSDIILFMEKGWTVIMQDMDHIYGSLYDLFNQNFTITGANKKNCRIALGSVINPMCFVSDKFHCIVILHEELIRKCEPPFLNRFEKHLLSFESIMKHEQLKIVEKIRKWIEQLFYVQQSNINFENLIVNYNDETIASLVIKHYDEQLKEDEIIKQCKLDLIKICSNFSLLAVTQSNIDKIEIENFLSEYKSIFEKASDINSYLIENNNVKSIVYTFDSITKELKLENYVENYEEIKIGSFNSEKYLNQAISKYFKDKNKSLLIIRLEWKDHAKHLQLIKFLIDKLELEYRTKNPLNGDFIKKSFAIVIHLNYYLNNRNEGANLNDKYKMSFLSGWNQIMIDNLDDKMCHVSNILFNDLNSIITNEKLFKFQQLSYDLCLNAINKLKYVKNCDDEDVFNARICKYKNKLVSRLTLGEFDDDYDRMQIDNCDSKVFQYLYNKFKDMFFSKISTIDEITKDWRLEILTNTDLNKISFNVAVILKNYILNQISFLYVELLYSIEKYFSFESLFDVSDGDNNDELKLHDLFFNIMEPLVIESENYNKAQNANHANLVNVTFGLKIPFILREIEIFNQLNDVKELIQNVCVYENEIFYLDFNDDNQRQEANRYLFNRKEIITQIHSILDNKTIYDKIDRNNELFKRLYLNDVIRIKFDHLSSVLSVKFIESLILLIIKHESMDDTLAIYYYSIVKYMKLIEKIYEFLKNFNGIIDIYALDVNLNENDYTSNKYENFYFIQDKIYMSIIDYAFNMLIDKCCQKNKFQFNEIVLQFRQVAIESSMYKVLCQLDTKPYEFLNEIVNKLNVIFSHDDGEHAKFCLQRLTRELNGKFDKSEYLTDVNLINEIIRQMYSTKEDNALNQHEEVVQFEIYYYSLILKHGGYNNDTFIHIFEKVFSNDNTSRIVSTSILQNLFENFKIDGNLNVFKNNNQLFDVLDHKIHELNYDSNTAFILVEIFNCHLDEIKVIDEDYTIDKWISDYQDPILDLFEILRGRFNEQIKYKHLSYLTAIAYMKKFLAMYCECLLENKNENEEEFHRVFNSILTTDCISNIANSLRMFVLRLLNKKLGSYLRLKEFVLTNVNIKWKLKLKFGDIKGLLDLNIINDVTSSESIKETSELISQLIDTKCSVEDDLKSFDKIATSLNQNERLTSLLASFNTMYTRNTNTDFYKNDSLKAFEKHVKTKLDEKIQDKSLYSLLLFEILYNFPKDNWLQANPDCNIDTLKLVSVVLHCFSLTASFSQLRNPLFSLFIADNGGINKNIFALKEQEYWICADDNEEYEILNALKDVNFVSYNQDQINQQLFAQKPGFALFKCSDECTFYYTVGNCTNVMPGNREKCPKGHPLGGTAYNQLHVRKGHEKIYDAVNFIARRLNELKLKAPKGYQPHDSNHSDVHYSVRSMRPLTYRILHLILHSNLYMLRCLNLYTENDMKTILGLKANDISILYLRQHITKDYEIIKNLLAVDDHHMFIHAILCKMPHFLQEINLNHQTLLDNRNNFEQDFEKNLILPQMNSINATINECKRLFAIKEQADEIAILLSNDVAVNDDEIKNVNVKYPHLKHMNLSEEINMRNFEKKFNNLNLQKKYPIIDLVLKNKENLEKLETLPYLITVTNYLMDKYDHKISRNEARVKRLNDCIHRNCVVYEDFEKLKELWNKYLLITFTEGCNRDIKNVELTDESALTLLLTDSKLEDGAGVLTRLAMHFLATCQNEFLESVLSNAKYSLYLTKFDRNQIELNSVKPHNNVIVDVTIIDFEGMIKSYSIFNDKNIGPIEINYNYEAIEFNLINELVIGKRFLSTQKDKYRLIKFHGELLSNHVRLIDNLRKQLPQEEIEINKQIEIKKLIEELVDDVNGYEIMQNIYKSLNTFICFMNSNYINNDKTNLTLKEYAVQLNLKNISDHVSKQEPISSLCLKNIIEIYEIFELEWFYMIKNQFNEKYKNNINDNQLLDDIKRFIKTADDKSIELPLKIDLYRALIRIAMRCLMADLNEEQELYIYLSTRTDLWPEKDYERKLENLEEYFPKSITLSHTLGNMFQMLDEEFRKPVIEKAIFSERQSILSTNINQRNFQSSKDLHKHKLIKKHF